MRVLSIVLVAIGIAIAEYDYVAQLKLSLREERIPNIINDLLNNSLESLDIKTSDIIQLSKLDRCNETGLVQVFSYYNVSEVYSVDNLEKLFTVLGINAGVFYKALINKLELTSQQEYAIGNLSIPANFWTAVAVENSDNIYKALRQGNYSAEHIDAALQAANKTQTEIFTGARDLLREKVLQLPSSNFTALLKNNGWTQKTALDLYKALNITTPDVYEVEKFREIFTNITDGLNTNNSLGVFIGPKQLAIHKSTLQNLETKIDGGVNVKVEANSTEVIVRETKSLGINLVEVATIQAGPKIIEIVQAYNSTGNCTYVNLIEDEVQISPVQVQNLTVQKNNLTFILGAPLICDDTLYGLAREENSTSIIFDGFYIPENSQIEEEGTSTPQIEEEGTSNSQIEEEGTSNPQIEEGTSKPQTQGTTETGDFSGGNFPSSPVILTFSFLIAAVVLA